MGFAAARALAETLGILYANLAVMGEALRVGGAENPLLCRIARARTKGSSYSRGGTGKKPGHFETVAGVIGRLPVTQVRLHAW